MPAPGIYTVSGADKDGDGRPDDALRFPMVTPASPSLAALTYPAFYPAFY